MKKVFSLLFVIYILVGCTQKDSLDENEPSFYFVKGNQITIKGDTAELITINLENKEQSILCNQTISKFNTSLIYKMACEDEYMILYEGNIWEPQTLYDGGVISKEELESLGYPLGKLNENKVTSAYIDYIGINTINNNNGQFTLYKNEPKAGINLEYTMLLFTHILDDGCLVETSNNGEYTILHKNKFYQGFELLRSGHLTVDELKNIGYPFEKRDNC